MTANFYDDDKIPVKTVHFGAEGYDDYTVAPHDEDKPDRSIKIHKVVVNWNDCSTAGALSRYFCGTIKFKKTAVNNYYIRFNLKK